jgi:hypothetical protein
MKTNNIGSSFDSWLREEGIHDEVSAAAINRVIARQVELTVAGRRDDQVRNGSRESVIAQPRWGARFALSWCS